jgi:hypothetical protein
MCHECTISTIDDFVSVLCLLQSCMQERFGTVTRASYGQTGSSAGIIESMTSTQCMRQRQAQMSRDKRSLTTYSTTSKLMASRIAV